MTATQPPCATKKQLKIQRCEKCGLELRISDFASLGIFTSVEMPLQINPFYAKQTQFPKAQNERKLTDNN